VWAYAAMQPPYYLLARPPLSATYYEHEYCVRVVVSRRGVASFFFFFVRHLLPDLPVFYPSGEDYLPMFRKYVPKKEQTGNSRSGSLSTFCPFGNQHLFLELSCTLLQLQQVSSDDASPPKNEPSTDVRAHWTQSEVLRSPSISSRYIS